MKPLNYIELNTLINLLRITYETEFERDWGDFLNGQCFYFIKIMKILIPNIELYKMGDHYIFRFQNLYYDAYGNFESNQNWIASRTNTEALFPIAHLILVTNLEKEEMISTVSGIVTIFKSLFYEEYAPTLIQVGTNFLKQFENTSKSDLLMKKRTPSSTFHSYF